jgi:hypothetical protein
MKLLKALGLSILILLTFSLAIVGLSFYIYLSIIYIGPTGPIYAFLLLFFIMFTFFVYRVLLES